jgi:hypothetical protein
VLFCCMDISLKLFFRVSQFTLLFPLFIGVFRYKKSIEEQRLMTILLLISFLTEIVAVLVVEFSSDPNNWFVYHLFNVIMFFIMSRIYKRLLSQTYNKKLIDMLLIAFIVFAIVNTLLFQPLDSVNSNAIVVSNLMYIFFSVSYFYQLISVSDSEDFRYNPMFWLNSGVILHNSGTLVLFLLVNFILDASEELILSSWILNAGLNIMLNGFYTISLCMRPQT